MDEKQQGETNKESGQSPQAGNTPTGQDPQGYGSDTKKDTSYQPGQGGTGGGGYQPGQSEMPGGTTSRPDEGRGTDASES